MSRRPRRDFIRTTAALSGAAAFAPWTLEIEAAQGAVFDANRNRLADIALDTARRLGASYADIRINRYRFESITTRERQVQGAARNQDFGFGVRVLVKGAWGFAASPIVTEAEVRRVTGIAGDIASANAAFQRKPVVMAPVARASATWKSAFDKDPFDVPLDEKTQFLLQLNDVAMRTSGVSFVNSSMYWVNEQRFLATSDGSRIDQYIIRGQPGFTVTAVSRETGDFQTRRSLNMPKAIGYEYMDRGLWMEEAAQAASEAVTKLKAKPVEPGRYDLVLHPSHLWLTIHESIGHSTELDRALWLEANYAGTSFLTPDKVGKLRIGSPIVNFVADRVQPHGLATVGYDDEGVPGQRWYLVRDGMFVDWQTTRELAGLIGRTSSYGCLHAQSWSNVPFARMPNVSLEAAGNNTSLDDLVRGVDRGILIRGDGSFSIDQQRYNFQFGGQTFWEIRGGKIVGMLRDVAYQSRTTDFWGSCDGLGGPRTYELGGAFNDGKGEPTQINAVSHGCPPARFRQVTVLNTSAPTA
jgi:TldD protein